MKELNRIEINIRGPKDDQELGIFLPWDADMGDWESTFKVILTHQGFSPQTIKELFYDEFLDKESKDEDYYRKQLGMDGSDFDPISSKPNLSNLFGKTFDGKSTFDKQESNMANAY